MTPQGTSRTSCPQINHREEISHYGAAFSKARKQLEDGPVSGGAKGWHAKYPRTGKSRPSRTAQRLRRVCIPKPNRPDFTSHGLIINWKLTDRGSRS